eukprot:TCONS_00047658-protein
MGDIVEFPYSQNTSTTPHYDNHNVDRNGNETTYNKDHDSYYINMDDGRAVRVNGIHKHNGGHSGGGGVGGYTFKDGSDNIKELSNSKMSINSYRSTSSINSNNRFPTMNGYANPIINGVHEERQITVVMEPGDTRFGFSVIGGVDEGFLPRVDNVARGSPSERCGLQLNDEITEVNGFNVERASHHEIIVQIHNSKKKIALTVKRTKNVLSNGSIHENGIDIPPPYNQPTTKTFGETSSGKSSVDGTDGATTGMMKFATRQPKATLNVNNTVAASVNRDSNVPSKFVNPAYERDEDDEFGSMDNLDEPMEDKPKSFNFSHFVTVMDSVKGKLPQPKQQEDFQTVQQLLNDPRFKSAIKMHNRMAKMQVERKTLNTKPVAIDSQFTASEVGVLLQNEENDPEATALGDILNKPELKEMLRAHDHIAKRECLNSFPEDAGGYEDDGSDPDDVDDFISGNDEQQVKIVRIDKTDEPLGATVCNEGDAVVISRIVKGGAAEKSGLLHEGDEILEINNNSVRGKDVNEVVELLSELEGTLTFVLVPGMVPHKETLRHEDILVMKALFDYEHGSDSYIPCEELGLSFMKGDLLEILNQNDPDWWQARFLEEKHHGLAGLVPSKQFQMQRELMKISVQGEDTEPITKEKKKCFCGRARRKGKKVPMNSKSAPLRENEILTYEDMIRIHPDPHKKRPIVLIGPPQVGRMEIRQKMISQFPSRFAAAVPHTTRTATSDEENGVDYNFVSRNAFEKSIAAAEFIEHGHFNGHYYGTSFSAVRKVVESGKTCVLNMHCQALPVLKTSNLLPHVIFITVPRIDQLNRLREYDENGEPFNPNVRLKKNELDELIEKARDMSRNYGHFFDKVLINNDLDGVFDEILDICNQLESEPQWVPSSWVRLS